MSWFRCPECKHVFTEPAWTRDFALVGYGSVYERMECGESCCPECGFEDYVDCPEPVDDE